MGWIRWVGAALLLSGGAVGASDEKITAAVSANFAPCMRTLVPVFEQETGVALTLAIGSTGKHYAQIRQGAPFDIFFAADSARPALLEEQGLAKGRFTYAKGRLVLWSPQPDFVNSAGQVLQKGGFQYLAIANPKLAPYGMAAEAVLRHLQVWQALQPKLVRGEDVGQTLQFVHTGAADMGFVALSQIVKDGKPVAGSYWLVPEFMYPAIEQQAVLLNTGNVNTGNVNTGRAVIVLADFMQSAHVQQRVRNCGYAPLEAE